MLVRNWPKWVAHLLLTCRSLAAHLPLTWSVLGLSCASVGLETYTLYIWGVLGFEFLQGCTGLRFVVGIYAKKRLPLQRELDFRNLDSYRIAMRSIAYPHIFVSNVNNLNTFRHDGDAR